MKYFVKIGRTKPFKRAQIISSCVLIYKQTNLHSMLNCGRVPENQRHVFIISDLIIISSDDFTRHKPKKKERNRRARTFFSLCSFVCCKIRRAETQLRALKATIRVKKRPFPADFGRYNHTELSDSFIFTIAIIEHYKFWRTAPTNTQKCALLVVLAFFCVRALYEWLVRNFVKTLLLL